MKALLPILALLAAAVAAPAAAEPIALAELGFTMERPDHWRRVSSQENAEMLERADFRDRQLQQRIVANGGGSLIVLLRESGSPSGVNPTIKVGVYGRAQMNNLPPQALAGGLAQVIGRNFADMRIEEGPAASRRFGFEGAYIRLSYRFSSDGDAQTTRAELWVVLRGDLIFLIGVSMAADEPESTRAEIETILDSVRIAPITV